MIDHKEMNEQDYTIEAVEFYLDGKLVKEWSINEWNPELTCSEPFNRAVVTYGPPRRTIITLCEPVPFEGVNICRKE